MIYRLKKFLIKFLCKLGIHNYKGDVLEVRRELRKLILKRLRHEFGYNSTEFGESKFALHLTEGTITISEDEIGKILGRKYYINTCTICGKTKDNIEMCKIWEKVVALHDQKRKNMKHELNVKRIIQERCNGN